MELDSCLIPTCAEKPDPVTEMLNRIAMDKSAFFKSQQRGEPDLSDEQKYEIVKDLYNIKPELFLSRYHQYLCKEEVILFEPSHVDLYRDIILLSEPGTSHTPTSNAAQVKSCEHKAQRIKTRNRRYGAMRELVEGGDYFSDWSMRNREPVLYEELIGRYLSSEERQRLYRQGGDSKTMKLSSALLDFYDKLQADDRVNENVALSGLMNMDVEGRRRIDDDSNSPPSRRRPSDGDGGSLASDESEMDDDEDKEADDHDREGPKAFVEPALIDEPERELLRAEFVQHMQERFLDGTDDYDYPEIDGNSAYDETGTENQEAEEAYFDSEEPAFVDHSDENSLTDPPGMPPTHHSSLPHKQQLN